MADNQVYSGVWYGEGDLCSATPMWYQPEASELGASTVEEFGLLKATKNAMYDCLSKNINRDPYKCISISHSGKFIPVKRECRNVSDNRLIDMCECRVEFSEQSE